MYVLVCVCPCVCVCASSVCMRLFAYVHASESISHSSNIRLQKNPKRHSLYITNNKIKNI